MSISPPRGHSPGPCMKNPGQTEHCGFLSQVEDASGDTKAD